MARFLYQAINQTGDTVTGVLEGDSSETVEKSLAEKGLIPTRVTAEGSGASSFGWADIRAKLTPLKMQDLILFTKQFRTMVKAGMPILNLLRVLEEQTENARLKETVRGLEQSVREGRSLQEAFRTHPNVFSPLYCGMIRAGESSGALGEVMDRLIYIVEHEHKIKSDIKSALTYPVTVILFLGVAFLVLLTFAIPRFAQIFLKAGIELPMPTRVCITLYQGLVGHWQVVVGAVLAGAVFLVYYLRTGQGKYVRDAVFLRLPVFGPLFLKAYMSRFASIFAILYESGITVVDCMGILAETIGNLVIAGDFKRIIERVKTGRGISEPLREAGHFTPMVVHMVALGEGAGKLEEMLREVSRHYDDEVDYAIKNLSDTIVPFLTVGLAGIVGFFALAVFLPMWDLTKLATKS